jgi:hypothetical protein
VIRASDHVLTVVGVELDRIVHDGAPGAVLRFVPNLGDDPEALRDGSADLAVGIYGDLPPELRTRVPSSVRAVPINPSKYPILQNDYYVK